MFWQKNKAISHIDTLIGSNTAIAGDIHFAGGLRVDGRVCGSVVAEGESLSMLVLSEQGVIEGKVKVTHMVVNGTVKGPIYVEQELELQSHARIMGDIHYRSVKIHQGASVEGKMIRIEGVQSEKLVTLIAPPQQQKKTKEESD
ncbi:MAG: polymer-forming cytoskeletal protein [Nitrosomonas sp.]|jgi:cytoskeletal protein CcmA (bactofilin family)|nr:polymer-forming cytoskeletal protein [Nitrosomonas sp.]MCC7135812.1 polymer-forming cytoskeletal protein [Nitrosomonas sp.]